MLVGKKVVIGWMILGLLMIFFQIIIGGVTRLTGSGLSITKWEIVTGTVPPLNDSSWNKAFELYKETPQYHKLNRGMSLGEFKFIYFWEYLHRLWARFMGLVFIVPFVYFLSKKWIDGIIVRRLITVAGLAAIVGLFGWIMVASGLIDRPWVNAYKLSIHLCLALLVYVYLLWTVMISIYGRDKCESSLKGVIGIFLLFLGFQLFLGGMMSGMKASLLYGTWPKMGSDWFPPVLFQLENWTVDNFVDYDKGPFLVALVQFMHRLVAYILILLGIYIVYKHNIRGKLPRIGMLKWMFISVLIIQALLGILTLLKTMGMVPLLYGVLHQGVAIILLTVSIILFYFHSYKSTLSSVRQ